MCELSLSIARNFAQRSPGSRGFFWRIARHGSCEPGPIMFQVFRLRSMVFAWLVVLVGVAALACGHRQVRLEGVLAGDAPLAITNRTSDPIVRLNITNRENYHAMELDLDRMSSPILPGQTARFSLQPGTYSILASTGAHRLLDISSFSLAGATQIVVHDGERPPTDVTPLQGFTVKNFERFDRAEARAIAIEKNQARARRDRALADCQRWVTIPPASPGRTKSSGRWHCVFGGGTYTGSDYVDLVQLADGKLTATVSGVDRNATWEGSVVADEVHFRWTGVDASGATLRIDPSGKAMIGDGHTFTDGGECLSWKLTCTR